VSCRQIGRHCQSDHCAPSASIAACLCSAPPDWSRHGTDTGESSVHVQAWTSSTPGWLALHWCLKQNPEKWTGTVPLSIRIFTFLQEYEHVIIVNKTPNAAVVLYLHYKFLRQSHIFLITDTDRNRNTISLLQNIAARQQHHSAIKTKSQLKKITTVKKRFNI